MKIFGFGASRAGWRSLAVATFLLGLGICVGQTQHAGSLPGSGAPDQSGQMPQMPDVTGTQHGKDDDLGRGVAERQAKLREEERQKRLVADTERLLTLATQLHDDVGKTNKNILSLDVVRRADEIEKLAHSVKERMKE